jgi:hypothetical protein
LQKNNVSGAKHGGAFYNPSTGERLKQEDHKFKANLIYIERLCFQGHKKEKEKRIEGVYEAVRRKETGKDDVESDKTEAN